MEWTAIVALVIAVLNAILGVYTHASKVSKTDNNQPTPPAP